MMNPRQAQPLQAAAGFPLPSDASAWWAFFSSSAGGLFVLHMQEPRRMREAGILLFAFGCLFLSSDWISSLSGKGLAGEVPRGRAAAPAGILLCGLALLGLAWFCAVRPAAELRFWLAGLACGALLTALMFLLRLELEPFHSGLLALSSLLCTAPALFIAFLAFGPGAKEAWAFWMAPALFFPASSVFAWTWLRGFYHARSRLALLSLPIMALVVAALSSGADLPALALTAYLIYMNRRLLARYRQGADRMPGFSEIRRLGREQTAWNGFIVISWLLSVIAP